MLSVESALMFRMPKSREEIEKRKGMWEWEGNPSVIKNTFLEREDGLKVSWCQNLSDVPEGIVGYLVHLTL